MDNFSNSNLEKPEKSIIWIPVVLIMFIPVFAWGTAEIKEIGEIDTITPFLIFIAVYFAVALLVALPFYIYLATCLMFLAKKAQAPHCWMAWIPILNIYLLCKIAGKPGWWLIYFFLPAIFSLFTFLPFPPVLFTIIGILASLALLAISIILIILWREIAKKLDRPGWWGVLILVPIVNFVMMGILAFSSKENFKNKKAHILLLIIILFVGGVFAWQYFEVLREEVLREEIRAPEEEILEEKIPPQIEYSKERLPRFEDFPILERFEGIPAQVDLLSHPKAMEFRTRLIEGAKKGPNFAGHYTVVTWGCGANCAVVAIVDAKTGIVHFAPFILNVGGKFKIDSNLFIVNPPRAIDGEFPEMFHTAYYKWENNRFMLLWSTDEKTR